MVSPYFSLKKLTTFLVTRQYERPGHQQRLIQTFTEDIFIFSLVVYIAHWSFLDNALYKITYLLTYLKSDDVFSDSRLVTTPILSSFQRRFCPVVSAVNSTAKKFILLSPPLDGVTPGVPP